MARTTLYAPPSTPPARGVQCEPSHRAMFSAADPPALAKVPPAYSAAPEPSSKTVSALTDVPPAVPSPIPTSSGDQLAPSNLAMRFALVFPAAEKVPAAYSEVPEPSSNEASDWTPPVVTPYSLPLYLARLDGATLGSGPAARRANRNHLDALRPSPAAGRGEGAANDGAAPS